MGDPRPLHFRLLYKTKGVKSNAMGLFRTDLLVICYSNVEAAKQWWIETFDCRPAELPGYWDDRLPSDVALKLPEDSEPTILLSDRAEVQKEGFKRQNDHPIIFSDKLKKAREYLLKKGRAVSLIQSEGGMEFFEIRDSENNVIEICTEL